MAAEKLPAFPVRHPRAFASPEQYLDWLCRRQLKGLYPLVTQGMEDRLGYELKAIGSVGLASWLLLLRELATACPVRSTALCAVGAAPGSLACRCLGLSEVDPYRHGLLFERFINPATPVHMHADAAASAVPGLLEYAVNVYGDQWGWSVSREGDEAVWAVAPNVTVRACSQLDVLASAEHNARRLGAGIRPVRCPIDDPAVLAHLASGCATGCCDLDTADMRELRRRFVPMSVEHVALLYAVHRPGPLEYADALLRRRHGKEPVPQYHPLADPVLAESYGIPVYQEQVMTILQLLGRFTLAEADLARRDLVTRKADPVLDVREHFLAGCRRSDLHKQVAERVFKEVLMKANHAYCRAHAMHVAYMACRAAWAAVRRGLVGL